METKTIEKGFFEKNIWDFSGVSDIIQCNDENGNEYYNFQADCYDGLVIWMGMAKDKKDLKRILDNCDGSFVAYLYYFEDGRTSIAMEYPYDISDETVEFFVEGAGAEEIRSILKPCVEEYKENYLG